MKISIIIATYNASKTLKRCLDSIIPQLTDETELIIIDGGSKDNTNEIISSYGNKVTKHISEPDKGIYDAWNKGIKLSHGEWIMFIGADDILLPNALTDYLNFTSTLNNEDVDFISCKIKSIKENGDFLKITGKLWDYKRCRINMDVTHVASLTNINYFKRIGLFNINYKICGDYDLLMRGGKMMKALFVNKLIAEMPIGGTSFSIKALKEQFDIKHKVGKVPILLCSLIYLFQIFLFYTYSIRHSHKL